MPRWAENDGVTLNYPSLHSSSGEQSYNVVCDWVKNDGFSEGKRMSVCWLSWAWAFVESIENEC